MSTAPSAPVSPALLAVLALLAACSGGDAPADAGAADEAPAPRAWLEVDRSVHDFGAVYPAELKSTTFELVAAGEEPLVIEKVMRSCGCTQGEVSVVASDGSRSPIELEHPYPPGTRFELLASLNTKGRAGVQKQSVRLVLADNPEMLTFELRASIEPFLVADPPLVVDQNASILKPWSTRVTFSSRSGEPFQLDCRRDVLDEALDVRFAPLEPGEEGRASRWAMDVQLGTGGAVGPRGYQIVLLTDVVNAEAEPGPDKKLPVHTGEYWIRLNVRGAVTVWPPRLVLGRVAPGKSVTKKVVLRNQDPDFELGEIEVALQRSDGSGEPFELVDQCRVAARATEPGSAWEVELEVADPSVKGNFDGLMVIRVGHPLEELVLVPFSLMSG